MIYYDTIFTSLIIIRKVPWFPITPETLLERIRAGLSTRRRLSLVPRRTQHPTRSMILMQCAGQNLVTQNS
jgi:hypothetical protein